MSAVLVSLTDNNHSKVIETVNKTEEEIFRFVAPNPLFWSVGR